MSSNNSNNSGGRRGRGGRRGQRSTRGGRGAAPAASSGPVEAPVAVVVNSTKTVPVADKASANGDADDGICWICAEPVKFYAVPECNHRTCHICALRLRALYRRKDCTFCKHPQVSIIFTSSPTKLYSEFTPNDIPFTDPKLEISFETEEMMEETLIILRFNCPDVDCDFVAQGWHDLKWHAKDKHDSILCDLCIRHKKIFAHEHTLYSHVTFSEHMPSAHSRRYSAQEKAQAGSPDFVHPMCEFCRECFFGDDELFGHLREHHEECFVCKREGTVNQYFQNYERLEQHFKKQHFPCAHPTCLEQKFVVFSTMLDLQGHQVEVHGEQMSSRDRRDARRVDTSFVFGMESSRGGRGGGRGGYRGEGIGRQQGNEQRGPPQPPNGGRAREPPPHAAIQPPPQPGPPPGAAPRGGSRRAAFGSSLTVDGAGASSSASTPAVSQQEPSRPTPSRTPEPNVDPETAEQHAQFLSLLDVYASANGVTAIRSAIRSFRASESSARDMVGMIHTVLDENMNTVSTIINALVPLFDEEKRKDVLNAWNGMKIEQRDQFPSLTPTALGSGFADIASGRVLNVKHSTAPHRASGPRAGSSSRSSGAVWDRVERAAAGLGATPSSQPNATARASKPNPSAFPQLGGGPRSNASSMSTPWSSGGAQASQHLIIAPARTPEPTRSGPGPKAPPIASSSAFPDLPSSSNSRVVIPKLGGNQSLRRIAGENPAPANVWGAESSGGNGGAGAEFAPVAQGGGGKGKKKKGKETLFTLGSFPN